MAQNVFQRVKSLYKKSLKKLILKDRIFPRFHLTQSNHHGKKLLPTMNASLQETQELDAEIDLLIADCLQRFPERDLRKAKQI